jgi:hypothetical protein
MKTFPRGKAARKSAERNLPEQYFKYFGCECSIEIITRERSEEGYDS